MRLSPGETFAGFTIVRLLGAGGMGEVYLAHHPRLPRQEAVKVLPADVSADTDYRARFEREAALASKLWHPHIVAVHDRGECDGHLWISMDYVDGLDASRRLAGSHPVGMPINMVCDIVTAVAGALDYAHGQGLIHRDVKPANIMLSHAEHDGAQRVLLTDFGIARDTGDVSGLTATNMTVGTLAYSAPEQLMGSVCDGRADQYALAATAYHLLTGTQLFAHSNPAVLISHQLSSPPPAIGARHPSYAALDPVLHTALAQAPEHRFPTCTAFAVALADAAAAQRVSAFPVSSVPTASRPDPWPDPVHRGSPPRTASHPATPWLILVSSLAVITLISLILVLWHPWSGGRSATKATAAPWGPYTSGAFNPPGASAGPTTAAAPVVLPGAPPSGSGCEGTVLTQHDIEHRYLGPIRIFLTLGPGAGSRIGCISAVTASGRALPPIHVGVSEQSFGFPSPATDATGNTFVTYNPGRYDGVITLIPNASGFEDIGWDDDTFDGHYIGKHAYYYAELVGPGGNGQYTIRMSRNDCTPDCAGGTITHQDLRWDGGDYVE